MFYTSANHSIVIFYFFALKNIVPNEHIVPPSEQTFYALEHISTHFKTYGLKMLECVKMFKSVILNVTRTVSLRHF